MSEGCYCVPPHMILFFFAILFLFSVFFLLLYFVCVVNLILHIEIKLKVFLKILLLLLLLFFHTFSLLAADGGNDFGWFELIQFIGTYSQLMLTLVLFLLSTSSQQLSGKVFWIATQFYRIRISSVLVIFIFISMFFFYYFGVDEVVCGDGEECCRCSLKLLLKSNNYIVAAAVQFQR